VETTTTSWAQRISKAAITQCVAKQQSQKSNSSGS
jgi:hypothetical protein